MSSYERPERRSRTRALERRVDRTVRIVALGGDPGWAHVNYSREVALDEETTLRVEATFGARVNGATVRHSAHGIVYEALDYGRCLGRLPRRSLARGAGAAGQ